jgi:hypothetical protein
LPKLWDWCASRYVKNVLPRPCTGGPEPPGKYSTLIWPPWSRYWFGSVVVCSGEVVVGCDAVAMLLLLSCHEGGSITVTPVTHISMHNSGVISAQPADEAPDRTRAKHMQIGSNGIGGERALTPTARSPMKRSTFMRCPAGGPRRSTPPDGVSLESTLAGPSSRAIAGGIDAVLKAPTSASWRSSTTRTGQEGSRPPWTSD